MNKHEIKRNKHYAAIARRLIREKDDLAELRDSGCKVAYLSSQEEKTTGKGTRLIFGECKLVPDNLQWICPYHILIIIYEQNCAYFTEHQLEVLIWHELKHIGISPDGADEQYYIIPHDYEEFKAIIDAEGLDWGLPE